MTERTAATFTLTSSETRDVYAVSGVGSLCDPSGARFTPEEVVIIHRNVPWGVTIRGPQQFGDGWYTGLVYSVTPAGDVEPHYRCGPAPVWVSDLIRRSDPTRLGQGD